MTGSTNSGSPEQSLHAATAANRMAITVMTGSTMLGGVALLVWNWPLFWAAVGLAAGAIVGAWRGHIMNAFSVYRPLATGRSVAGDPDIGRPGKQSARYQRAR